MNGAVPGLVQWLPAKAVGMSRPGPRLTALALVLLLHLLLLQLLQPPPRRTATAAPAAGPGLLVRLLPGPALPRHERASADDRRPPRLRSGAGARTSPQDAAPLSAVLQQPLHAGDSAPAQPEAVPAASSPLAASAPAGSLLDSAATRRAVRMAAREPLLAERAASASGDPGRLSSQQGLARDIAKGANGDCLKGEFAGAGMGLLSLPFWALAEARGKCRR